MLNVMLPMCVGESGKCAAWYCKAGGIRIGIGYGYVCECECMRMKQGRGFPVRIE